MRVSSAEAPGDVAGATDPDVRSAAPNVARRVRSTGARIAANPDVARRFLHG